MMRHHRKKRRKTSIRVLKIAMIGLGLLILGRLVQLQVVNYDLYSPLSRENSLRQEVINPARGLIYDRNGNLIVDNEPIYSITITPASYDRSNTPLLANLLEMPLEDVQKRIDEAQSYSWYRSSRLFTELSFPKFSLIQENIWQLPGIGHQIESKRHYSVDSIRASHVLGYLREVSEQKYLESNRYHMGDKAGKSGLELVYEDQLRGSLGLEYIRINALGQSLGPFNEENTREAPQKGNDLYTTLDTDLQLRAEDLMKGRQGAVVALDPNDGSILSMVSAPQYDIRRLSGRIDSVYWQSINADTTNPLYNRAISSRQPPGSTFKPLMALIGLEMGIITPETVIDNPGYYYRGRRYGDLADPGKYDVQKALEKSSNTFFFWMMDKIASSGRFNQWHKLVTEFGVGRTNGIDLPYETSGVIPDSSYMNRAFGEGRWGIGDLINLGVGQGVISVSPLQMAVVAAGIANNGYRVQPHLVKRIRTPEGKILDTNTELHKISWVEQAQIDVVKEGMRRVVTDGSGRYYANLDSIKVAGKTGTAQNPHGKDHGWFISFAPLENPQIVVVVLMENSGYGSISAAPVASLLIEQYLKGKIERDYVYRYAKDFKPRGEEQNEEEETEE
ncbi:penicillin-binding protein 2 [Aliifodinibius sp. S!AR15-10]|uniref:penicillin-binding protein 2 n=1 Tax=Aliifodinibius sp. S!AR15-10 TaxID=2950437 RepID=UPI00286559A2|nr:penicillin-binding protein 2 [Aliifodinibius sp. S!AR15-10]MDR8389773.1 penicillin-binding protein 2 [Aliifodinibius sp. S!AR15-10]